MTPRNTAPLPRLLLLLLAAAGAAHAASVLDDLTADQTAALKAGKMVVRSQDVPGGPWPRLIVYTLVNAPVSTVESVFRDYPGASSYIPGLEAAKVLDRPDANTYKVEYTTKMPIVGDAKSTVLNKYSYDDSALVVKWNLIKADMADESTGELRAEPCATGCILRYTNYVKPKSSLAVVAKFAALAEVKKTVAAIKAESEKRAR